MANIGKSLFSLVKSNNGYFKSEKQADFILSMADFDNNDGSKTFHSIIDGVGVKSYKQITVDSLGVIRVEKVMNSSSKTPNKVTVLFERLSDSAYQEKLLADNQRQANRKIEMRTYHDDVIIYHQSLIDEIQSRINSYEQVLTKEEIDEDTKQMIRNSIADKQLAIVPHQAVIDEHLNHLKDLQ